MFASDLDATSRRQLDRGQRLVQLLRQPQYSPYPVEEQIVSIWSGTTGKFDDVPVGDVLRFERDFLDYLRRESKVLDAIRESGLFGDDEAQAVTDALKAFKPTFQTSEGTLPGRGDGRGGRGPGADRQAEAGLTDAGEPAGASRPEGLGHDDQEAHPRDGADRGVPDRQGAAARRGGRSVRA
jgi:hypothetical protein